MTQARIFIRNSDSRGLFELFLVSAVSSILLLRFYLHVMGYPTVGGTKYHVAHMLWGGALMLIAFVLNFAFLGKAVQRVVAAVGGVGFGVFIDEIGKLITRDNNYFFRPAVGIIYAIFVALYLAISFLTREQKLTSEEYQLNAMRQLEEAVHQDMDIHERANTRQLLLRANQQSVLTKKLLQLLKSLPVTDRRKRGVYQRMRRRFALGYTKTLAAAHFFWTNSMVFCARDPCVCGCRGRCDLCKCQRCSGIFCREGKLRAQPCSWPSCHNGGLRCMRGFWAGLAEWLKASRL